MHKLCKRTILVCLILLLVNVSNTDNAYAVAKKEAYFKFKDPASDTFVFKLTNQKTIEEARKIIAGRLDKYVMGITVKAPRTYNKPWNYHLDPKTISFFEAVAEVCDATINMLKTISKKWALFFPVIAGVRGDPFLSRK